MTDIIMIPLTRLIESADNVRRQGKKDGIGELAASIEAHGLLQSLVVQAADNGKFAVIAGGRRLRALRRLAKAGLLARNLPIPCRVVEAGEASELSLAENVVRSPMVVADEILAFSALAEKGHGPEDIAGRFGVSGSHVARRLKLARVSPKLIAALRKDEIDLDQIAALAVIDDHAAQEAAFFEAPEWARTPDRLRAQVTQAHVAETDKLVRFVGVDAYDAEGGAIVSDLFAEDDDRRWLADRDLLNRMAEAKLGSIAQEVRAEGWGFVEIALDGISWGAFPERIRQSRRPLSQEERVAQEHLYAQLDATEDESEIARIEDEIDALARSAWGADEIALAGAIITLSHDGAPRVERGLVRLEDVKRLRALRRNGEPSGEASERGDDKAGGGRSSIPAKLNEELLAHKTWGLRLALASDPELALKSLVFTLAGVLSEQPRRSTCLGVSIEEADVCRSITRAPTEAPAAYAGLTSSWRKRLPGDDQDLWAFICDAEQSTLLELLAVLIAPGINLRVGPHVRPDDARVLSGAWLADAASLDMSAHWSATPESYFAHVRREVILDAIREVTPGVMNKKLDKASKADVLARAKRLFKDSAWLPEPLQVGARPDASVEAVAAE